MKIINYYEIAKQKLKYLKYSDKTTLNYLSYIKQFLDNLNIPPSRLNSDDFQKYIDSNSSIHCLRHSSATALL